MSNRLAASRYEIPWGDSSDSMWKCALSISFKGQRNPVASQTQGLLLALISHELVTKVWVWPPKGPGLSKWDACFFHDACPGNGWIFKVSITVAECHNKCHDPRKNTLLSVVSSVVRHDRMFVVIFKLLHPGVKAFHFSFLALSQNILQSYSLKKSSKGMHWVFTLKQSAQRMCRSATHCSSIFRYERRMTGPACSKAKQGLFLPRAPCKIMQEYWNSPHLRRISPSRFLCCMCSNPYQTEVRSQWIVCTLLFHSHILLDSREEMIARVHSWKSASTWIRWTCFKRFKKVFSNVHTIGIWGSSPGWTGPSADGGLAWALCLFKARPRNEAVKHVEASYRFSSVEFCNLKR